MQSERSLFEGWLIFAEKNPLLKVDAKGRAVIDSKTAILESLSTEIGLARFVGGRLRQSAKNTKIERSQAQLAGEYPICAFLWRRFYKSCS